MTRALVTRPQTHTVCLLLLPLFAGKATEGGWAGRVRWEAWGWSSSGDPPVTKQHRALPATGIAVTGGYHNPNGISLTLTGKLEQSGNSKDVHFCPMSCALQGGKVLYLILFFPLLLSQ